MLERRLSKSLATVTRPVRQLAAGTFREFYQDESVLPGSDFLTPCWLVTAAETSHPRNSGDTPAISSITRPDPNPLVFSLTNRWLELPPQLTN